MADTVNFLQNGYSGEVLEDLLTYTVQGNDTVREGLIHIKTGIQHRYTLPAIKLGNIIQDNVPTPQPIHGAKGDDGTNEYQFTERHLEPSDFMVYLEFNPRDYEKYWRFAQPEGNLVFRELDPKNPGDDAPSPYGQEKRVYRKRHLDFRPRRRDGGQDYRTGRLHENRSQQGEIF
ncbi:hypothetical protein NIB75_19045 [Bacteroides uniformis]|nr:hypothetical protein [Bacteroides uniformis]